MYIRKINCAEGIFLPCFDKTLIALEKFEAENCSLYKNWDSLQIIGEKNEFSLVWRGHLFVTDYDSLLFFINMSPSIKISAEASVNGKKISLFSGENGANVPVEIKGKIEPSSELTEIKMFFSSSMDLTKCYVTLYWIGVLNTRMEDEIENSLPKYTTADWLPYLNKEQKPYVKDSILFSNEEIKLIKKRAKEPEFKEFFEELYNCTEKIYSQSEPEKEIREYMPVNEHLYRYVRVRDRGRSPLAANITTLAIAGILFEKPEWSFMAARMILCAVKTPCWFEGPQCCMEGSNWHHVCFVEDATLSAIAMALGFLGGVFTSKALQEIKEALEKNYKTIVKCCEEQGYRQFSNQGMVENAARMIGSCLFYSLGDEKYKEDIELCYKKQTELILNDYINSEFHCVEGISYYCYSIEMSIRLWKAYSRFKQIGLDKIIPKRVQGSLKYVDCMLSTVSPLGYVLPQNNTHGGKFSNLILNVFSLCYQWQLGRHYLKNRIERKEIANGQLVSLLMLLCYLPETIEEVPYEADEKYYIFERSGLGSYQYANGKFWFFAERNPRTGHFHSDRGSIVLEANGETVLADPGVTNYGNSLSIYMNKEDFHNLAHPDGISMNVQSPIAKMSADEAGIGCRTKVQLADFNKPSARVHYIQKIDNGIRFSVELKELYNEQVLSAVREGSFKQEGETASLTLCDIWELSEEKSLYINFMAYSPWEIQENTAKITLKKSVFEIVFSADNPFELTTDEAMQDFDLKPLYRLRLKTEKAYKHCVTCRGRLEK